MRESRIKAAWIEDVIRRFIASPANTMKNDADEPAWDQPIVGYSNGADPLYDFYKKDIGDFYVKPIEFLKHAFPNLETEPQDLTVISWVLPQTLATKMDHQRETQWPSERWARSRIFGEEVNDDLRRNLVESLVDNGVEAVAPILSPLWRGATSQKYSLASTWSERHAAYAAGLGTFGLSDGLITPKGKAHRVGSVIANIFISPGKRPYENHHAYCLHYAKGACGACIKKCPANAITKQGHNKERCRAYVNSTQDFVESNYGFKGYGCGFCQVGIPCESRIPEGIDA